jgi:hypothetical protein
LPVAEDESPDLLPAWQTGSAIRGDRASFFSDDQRTVIGVMGPEFQFPLDGTLVWIPSNIRAEDIAVGRFGQPLVARIVPGATYDAVRNELNTLARRLPERFGGPPSYVRLIGQHRAVVRSIHEEMLGQAARPLWVLLGAAAIVLLIACANVANLFLVRGEANHRDMAVRKAIGAGRGQLIRLQMSEAAIVAALAGVVAVILAALTLPAFLRAAPPDVPRLAEARINSATVLFTLVAGVVSALACGLFPALRGSAPDLRRLREGGRGIRANGIRARPAGGRTDGTCARAADRIGLLVRSFGRCGTSIPATTRMTSSHSRSRPIAQHSMTVPRMRVSGSISPTA